MACQFCEEPLPAQARYCPSCGTGVWPPPSGKDPSGTALRKRAGSLKLAANPTAHPGAVTSPKAIAAFAFGIAGWTILPILGAFIAVPLGHRALREIRQSPGRYEGSGLATIGLLMAYLWVIPIVTAVSFVALLLVIGLVMSGWSTTASVLGLAGIVSGGALVSAAMGA